MIILRKYRYVKVSGKFTCMQGRNGSLKLIIKVFDFFGRCNYFSGENKQKKPVLLRCGEEAKPNLNWR
jgi:hypothetical protein